MTDLKTLAGLLPAYEIGAELGRGGYGVVLAGVHKQLGRPVAIKELPPKLASDPAVRQRFLVEAKVLAGLDHPHIVPVYDFVEHDGVCVLVMESLPGGTVWGHFTQSGYTPSAACAVVMVACTGLHYAHQHGILHRDVKPENLLLTGTGQLKVADFGIAKVLGDDDALATNAGEILGTPAYIAPEQAQGTALGPPADVYAAGVMLYELLSGKLPFAEDGGGLAIVYRHVYEQPMPLLSVAPTVPPALAEVVMRALSTDPAQRYASAEEFGVAIGEAATRSFGRGWFEDTAIPVLAGGRILASTQLVAPPTTPTYDATPVTPQAAAAPPTAAVRPQTAVHVRGAAVDASPDSVVPVRQVLANPAWPVPWATLTALLLAVLAALALTGIGSPALTPSGTLFVNGKDVATRPVVDLSQPFQLRSRGHITKLELSVAGVPLVAPSLGKVQRDGNVTVDARGSRYLAAGTVRATATFTSSPSVSFPLRTKRSALASVPGIAAIILLVFALSYVISQAGPLRRRGRRRLASLIGLAIGGAVLGALAVVFAWLFGTDELSQPTVAACAVAGAAAGVAFGVTSYKAGRRARLRRIAAKQGLSR